MADISSPVDSEANPNTGPLEFETLFTGSLNDHAIELSGTGFIDEEMGLIEGAFDLRRMPAGMHPSSLGAFLFTGFPNSCRMQDPRTENPFSGGSYSYQRKYLFRSSGQRAVLDVTCEVDTLRRRLVSKFKVRGDMPRLEDVRRITPIFELWAPRRRSIKGKFHVGWQCDGHPELVTATAFSRYNPVDVRKLGGLLKHRYIKLDSVFDGHRSLTVTQWSSLLEQSNA